MNKEITKQMGLPEKVWCKIVKRKKKTKSVETRFGSIDANSLGLDKKMKKIWSVAVTIDTSGKEKLSEIYNLYLCTYVHTVYCCRMFFQQVAFTLNIVTSTSADVANVTKTVVHHNSSLRKCLEPNGHPF